MKRICEPFVIFRQLTRASLFYFFFCNWGWGVGRGRLHEKALGTKSACRPQFRSAQGIYYSSDLLVWGLSILKKLMVPKEATFEPFKKFSAGSLSPAKMDPFNLSDSCLQQLQTSPPPAAKGLPPLSPLFGLSPGVCRGRLLLNVEVLKLIR